MHPLIIVIRWLRGLLPGGAEAAWRVLAHASVRAISGPVRQGLPAPDVPRVAWMKVRPVLETFGGPPGSYLLGVPVGRSRGGAGRLCPVQPDHILRGHMPAACSTTDPSKPALPLWG